MSFEIVVAIVKYQKPRQTELNIKKEMVKAQCLWDVATR